MIKFHSIAQIEKGYFFEPAVADIEVLNGTFGNVTDGKFVPSETGASAVMQIEVGDDMGMDEYKIPAGTPLRTIKLAEMVGQKLEVYGYPLPKDFSKGDTVGKFKIDDIIGNKFGAVVTVQA